MAHCNNCGCNNLDCGCKDTYLTTPPPCPTPEDCPEAQPCSEVFDSQCIVYTATDILCNQDIIVTQNDTVQTALQSIIEYFCQEIAVRPRKYFSPKTFLANTPSTITHDLNTTNVVVALTTNTSLPYTAYVQGSDYTYTVIDSNSVSITLVPGGASNITIIG
jgi:hypothetical protein